MYMHLKLRRKIFYVKKDEFMDVAAFYRDVMKLAIIEEMYRPPYWVEFETGECKLCLHCERKDLDTRGNNQKIVFWVEDIEQFHAELAGSGAQVGEIIHSKDGSNSVFFLRDPQTTTSR